MTLKTTTIPIFKLYDTYRKEFLYWRKIKSSNSANYTFANEENSYRIGWSATEYPKRYVMCVSFGQEDKNGSILFTGDRVINEDNEVGVIKLDKSHARLIVKYGGKYKLVETSRIEKIGDIFHANKYSGKLNKSIDNIE